MPSSVPTPKHVAYLFTSFPKLSEKFLERELEGLARYTDLNIEIHTLIGGGGNTFSRFPLFRFRMIDWLALPFRFLKELARRPAVFHEMARLNDEAQPRSWLNGAEHYLGLAFAIVRAAEFRRRSLEHLHAVWATGPASAALLLHRLNDTPFSMGCHAYDLYRHGGDVLLREKIIRARFIQTSTARARDEIRARGAPSEKVFLIRRSAPPVERTPSAEPSSARSEDRATCQNPIQILCVGRLVEKKGYFELLTILRRCADESIPFTAKIIGKGPLREELERRISRLNLEDHVELMGDKPYSEVAAAYRNHANVLFFTGKTARSGDRDGLPNVIIEAMSAGVPVFASRSGAAAEAIQASITGELIDISRPDLWAAALRQLGNDPKYAASLRREAKKWVERECNPQTNALALAERLVS